MRTDIVGGAVGLWMATLVHKAAVLGFSFWVGHSLGADGVGVMAAVLAITWVFSTLAGWGLPDRAPFLGAAGDRSDHSQRLHGIFFIMVAAAHVVLFMQAERLGGAEGSEFLVFSMGLIVGSAAQSLSAVGFAWLRGAGRPRPEIASTTAAAAVLAVGAVCDASLGVTWAMAGLSLLVGSVLGGGLRPARPLLSDVGDYFRLGSGFLIFGLGSWVLGNIDILMARALFTAEAIGELQVGTMAVRGLALAPWLAATFMLRPSRHAWAKGDPPRPVLWAFCGAFVGAVVAGISWLAMPFLARGHAMPVASIDGIGWMSMAMAPTFYATVLLLPLAAQWHMKRTLRAVGMGLIVQVGVGWSASTQVDVATLVVVAWVGQVVTLMWLIQALLSTPQQDFAVGGGAGPPGEIGRSRAGVLSGLVDAGTAPLEE